MFLHSHKKQTLAKYLTKSNTFHSVLCRYGVYPLTAYAPKQPPPCRSRAISPETAESVKSVTPEPIDIETRRVVNMMCSVKPREDGCDLLVCYSPVARNQ